MGCDAQLAKKLKIARPHRNPRMMKRKCATLKRLQRKDAWHRPAKLPTGIYQKRLYATRTADCGAIAPREVPGEEVQAGGAQR